MKIWHRLFLLLLTMLTLITLSGVVLLQSTRNALQDKIGEEIRLNTQNNLNHIIYSLSSRADEVQALARAIDLVREIQRNKVLKTNSRDHQALIDAMDRDWVENKNTPAISAILNNSISRNFNKYIKYYRKHNGYSVFNELFATNLNGEIVGAAPRTSDYYQADEDWFRAAIASPDPLFSEVIFDESSQSFAINCNIRLHDEQGSPAGVLRAGINLRNIQEMIQSSRSALDYNEVDVFLVDQKGRLLFKSNKGNEFEALDIGALKFGEALNELPPVKQLLAGNSGNSIYERDGVTYFSTHVQPSRQFLHKGLEWMMVVDINLDEVSTPVQHLQKGALLIISATLLVALILGSILVFSILGPLNAVRKASVEIASGNLNARVKTAHSNDEIGQLAESFNIMTDHIRNNTELLEKNVAIRTRELEVALKTAKASNEAKSTFLSNMSHELRTPLNAILGFGQLIEMQTQSEKDSATYEHAQFILKAGRHLLELVNELLNLSQIESGKIEINNEWVNLPQLIDYAKSTLSPLADEKNITIHTTIPAEFDGSIWTDNQRLQQILFNLISNAIKYNTPDGSVFLELKRENNSFFHILVRDTGIGIAPEHQEQIFKPFHRILDKTHTIEGTGVGLAITQKLAELLGGKLGLESGIGKGSLFTVSIPIVDPDDSTID
ncbi:MAG: HAMP domain-containing protein [Candidatus Nitrohelix vancouverensis]|uniref:histidine kinase n=1 Tax=Candidatus Nitrohelix vancouverensis TaxID=2705534 RepID=A0A7T0C2L3_9BACT|nr:MAG: HAMP domain-containing protein [Candidatus Nitrohelix vancouverensis]